VKPDVSVVVVNHRSAGEAASCVASLRRAFASDGLSGEVVLVDCASGEAEVESLRRIAAEVFLPLAENRGYSGGCNAGIAKASAARVVLSNADVLYAPGSLRVLLDALEAPSVGAAAPLAYWDAESRVRMPPGYAPSFLRDLGQLVTGRWPDLDRRRFAAFARETLRLWETGGSVPHLTGAVLAMRRDIFEEAGLFDEAFPFEFEETDWEDRVRRLGGTLVYCPSARVQHLYARSAGRSPDAAARRAAGARLYRRRRYGRLGAALLERAHGLARPVAATRVQRPQFAARPDTAVAISPNPSLLPFAAALLSEDFELPPEVIASLAAGPVYLRTFQIADGQPVETFVWEKP
jgi:N-acetylglucosaminyl-diphospho-decaprenol L-rhamnosyltransferase